MKANGAKTTDGAPEGPIELAARTGFEPVPPP